jgi:hypothetical protein
VFGFIAGSPSPKKFSLADSASSAVSTRHGGEET